MSRRKSHKGKHYFRRTCQCSFAGRRGTPKKVLPDTRSNSRLGPCDLRCLPHWNAGRTSARAHGRGKVPVVPPDPNLASGTSDMSAGGTQIERWGCGTAVRAARFVSISRGHARENHRQTRAQPATRRPSSDAVSTSSRRCTTALPPPPPPPTPMQMAFAGSKMLHITFGPLSVGAVEHKLLQHKENEHEGPKELGDPRIRRLLRRQVLTTRCYRLMWGLRAVRPGRRGRSGRS